MYRGDIDLDVFGYIRVSTKTQMDGYGLKTQESAIIDFCQKNGYNLIEVFRDEGISGTIANRDGLNDLISSFGEVKIVVVLNTSRLWRSDTVKVLVHREFQKHSADVISIEQPNYSGIYNKNPNDFLVNGMMELLDQYERMSISMKLSKGRRTKAKGGYKACGNAPLGYKWNDKAKITVDDESAAIIELIFKKYLELGSLGKLKSFLDVSGFKTSRGNKFSKQSLVEILRNDFYKGVLRHSDLIIEGNHTPLVNKIVFGKVQALLKRNRKAGVENEK